MSVLVILEQREGRWNRVSFEAITAATQLDPQVHAVVIGTDAGEAAQYPLEKVWLLNAPELKEYTPDAYVRALEQLIKAENPSAIVFPHTYQVRDYAPKLATRFGSVLISDVIGFEDGHAVRQLFQGKLIANVAPTHSPQWISVQAGAFEAAKKGADAAPVLTFPLAMQGVEVRSKPEAPFRESQRAVDLSSASRIVAVGRGIKEQSNLGVVEELAAALGAELAASRPICDNGWLPMERQVGSSGQTVAPNLYMAVGISGAIQHLVGMKGSKTVVAINKDEDAPIFETADYGIVGDLFEVVPALIEEIKKAKA